MKSREATTRSGELALDFLTTPSETIIPAMIGDEPAWASSSSASA